MKRCSLLLSLPALTLALTACVQPTDSGQLSKQQLQTAADKLSSCDKIDALVAGQPNGFPQLRGALTQTRYGEIWRARYDMVGKGCEVWRGGGSGGYSYVCQRPAPDRDSGDRYYNAARDTARNCLADKGWLEREQPRKLGVGLKTVFSKPGLDTVVAVHLIRTDGLFDNQWSVYYMVGLPNERL